MFGIKLGGSSARRRRRINDLLALAALLAYTIFALFPLFWIFLMSIKKPVDIIATPPKFFFSPTLENYADVLSRPDFLQPFKNSILVSFGALFVSAIISLPAAYALARMNFRFKEDLAF
jgi:multiple sugar transport system permease protein